MRVLLLLFLLNYVFGFTIKSQFLFKNQLLVEHNDLNEISKRLSQSRIKLIRLLSQGKDSDLALDSSLFSSSSSSSRRNDNSNDNTNNNIKSSGGLEFKRPCSFDISGLTSFEEHESLTPVREFRDENNHLAFGGPVSHQVILRWSKGIKRVLLLIKPDESIIPSTVKAIDILRSQGIEVLLEEPTSNSLKDQECMQSGKCNNNNNNSKYDNGIDILTDNDALMEGVDLVIALGGDGLLMHANTIFNKGAIPPVLSFDFGSLGFLAPYEFQEFEEQINNIMKGEPVLLTLRMRLNCKIKKADGSVSQFNVLNEALIDRGASPFLSNVELLCDGQYLTTVQGDGIIISTPTGSTAYSLAAGGSMVHPSIPAILLTPICPHTLSFRPLILPDSASLRCIVPQDGRATAWVSFDGKYRQEIVHGDMIDIKMNPYPVPTINKKSFSADWFDSLRSSFMFNERAHQKPISSVSSASSVSSSGETGSGGRSNSGSNQNDRDEEDR